ELCLPTKRVLLVCSGNTCRSPMAEAMLRHALEAAGVQGITVESAGIGAWEGAAASEGAYLVLLERGLDLSAHRARLLTRELVSQADVILTMGRIQLGKVRELGGGARAHLLGEYGGRQPEGVEVADPYGADLDEYRETYRQLAELMPAVVSRLAGAA
ncbi:MAG TPA: low molecular weight protein arginine phosphatase, partial [Gemmatimonadales bacterium]|nr:low molecular weight protein arginine phosphatase [Gemmatimonadales bacterium]